MVKKTVLSKRLIISVLVGVTIFGISSLLGGLFSFATNIGVSPSLAFITAVFFGGITYYISEPIIVKKKKQLSLFVFIVGSLLLFNQVSTFIDRLLLNSIIPQLSTEIILGKSVLIYIGSLLISSLIGAAAIFIFYLLMQKVSWSK